MEDLRKREKMHVEIKERGYSEDIQILVLLKNITTAIHVTKLSGLIPASCF